MADDRELARAWHTALGKLQLDMVPSGYTTFLAGTRAVRLEGDTLTVEGNRLNVDEVNGRYRTMIERAVYHAFGADLRVLFVPKGSAAAHAGADEHPASADSAPGAHAGPLVGNLNRLYTFDRYIPAEGNRLAVGCCSEVLANSPFHSKPVVIHGRPGLGKTHLLHALAREAAGRAWTVVCVTAEEFATRFRQSLRNDSIDDFHELFRGVRLLLVDDVQDLAGKIKTQEEFVFTIDAVANTGGAVVVASEQHPSDLDVIERLKSRLSAWMPAQIQPFMAEERRRYVELLARESGVALPSWAVDRIVGIEAPSVRVLQGAVNAAISLVRCQMLDLRRLDAQLTRIAVLEATTGAFADRDLLETVARHFALCFEDLAGKSRKHSVTPARAIAAAALQERGKSLAQIGEVLGRDRSTILGLAERGRQLLETEPALRVRLSA